MQLEKATSYDDRSEIRRAIRKLKSSGGQDSRKKVGSANYRRAGYQARITVAIPNSVTGNVLPNKVSTDNISKIEVPPNKGTISYLKSRSTSTSKATVDSSSPRGSVSEPVVNGKVCIGEREGGREDREGRRNRRVEWGKGRRTGGRILHAQVAYWVPVFWYGFKLTSCFFV